MIAWTGKRGTTVLVIAVLAVSALARLYGLDYHSFRNDELSSWNRSNHEAFSDVIALGVRPDPHPPGYQTLNWLIQQSLGDSQTILRAPSAVAGLLAVFATFLLGRGLFGNREGIVAMALMGVSLPMVYFSQDARAYAFLILCAVASSHLLWKLIQNTDRAGREYWLPAAGYIVISAASCYLHYFGFILFSTQIAYLVLLGLVDRRVIEIRNVLLIIAAVAMLYLPWWQGFYEDLTATDAPPWIVPPGKDFPFRFLVYGMSNSQILAGVAFVLLLYLLVIEVRRLWKNRSDFSPSVELRNPDIFLAYWFLAPFTLVVVKSWISEPVASLRNLVIVLPALYLLVARGISQLPILHLGRTAASLVLVLLFGFQLVFGAKYYSTPQKHQFREAVQFIIAREDELPDTPVFGFAHNSSYFNYYFERLRGESRVNLLLGKGEDIGKIETLLDDLDADHFWYLSMATPEPDPEFVDYLDREFQTELREELYGASVRLMTTK